MSIAKLQGKTALEHHENSASGNQSQGTGGTTSGTTKCKASNFGSSVQQQQQQQQEGNATMTTTTTTVKTKNLTNAPILQPQLQQQQQQQQQVYLPQTSLLKIEQFVPTFNSRLRRPIHRSYSTLSNSTSSYIKRTTAAVAAAGGVSGLLNGAHHHPHQFDPKQGLIVCSAAIDAVLPIRSSTRTSHNTQLRRHPGRAAVTRQRSKSTSSSATNLPQTKINGGTSATQLANGGATGSTASTPNSAIVTQQPNGICRIVRLSQEQEKLPDRINYDRRGLTAIPIFEQEPNLRLLSLQHNLINVFHIPKEEEPPSPPPTVNCNADDASEKRDEEVSRTPLPNGRTNKLPQNNMSFTRIGLSLVSPNSSSSPPPPPPPPFITQPIPLGTNNYSSVNNKSAKRSSYLQKSLHYSAQQQLHQQQQQQPQTAYLQQLPQTQPELHYRFALKKSKSVISNYSRHLNAMRRNLQKSQLVRGGGVDAIPQMLNTLAGSVNLKSFDSGASGITTTTTDSNSSMLMSTCDLGDEEDSMLNQLNIKNKQLITSYGIIFQNLVFLDLYDNQIERIANIDGLPTLSVLLLGKNRITDISGLASLKSTLRVLDLHGNKITSISNKINCLQELKSLNLAGNQIRQINHNDFNGLLNLKELNLKRNKIKRIGGFQHLMVLERLWLCHNDLHKVEDMSSIAKAINLLEVTIENNPVSLAGDCVSFLVSYLPNLQSLSQMPITDQVRRAAMAWRKNKELSDANYSHLSTDVFNTIRREEVISNARTNWELLRSQQTMQQVAQRQKRSPKQRELAKINESNEAVIGFDELQEFIKLPPIQHQLQSAEPTEQEDSRANSSNSSLGPNVDSSSSCFSSDNEESSPKMLKSTTHAKKRYGKRPNSAAQPGIKQQETSKEINQRDHNNQQSSLVTITTTPPDCQQNSAGNAVPCDEISQQQHGDHLTLATPTIVSQHIQIVNGVNEPGDENASTKSNGNSSTSLHGISNASIAMLSPQADKLGHSKLLRTTTSAQPRVSTPTTPITASSSTLSLGFNNNNGSGNAYNNSTMNSASAHSGVGMGAGSTSQSNSTAANPKRYMQGSLMRSHTIVGSGGGGGGGGASTTGSGGKSRANIANQSQHQNLSTNNGTSAVADQKSGFIAVSCIVAPAATTTKASAGAGAPASNQATSGTSSKQVAEREREQGGDYLIEICGRYLNIYGQGALRFIDKQWSPAKANDVHTLNFSYINFNNIATILARIKVRFPHAENFVFRETNISCMGQLNALAELQGIASLFIDPEGNAITTKDLWRLYAVYRLSHWGLKLLNGLEVTESEIDAANVMYAGLSDLVLWSMPEAMLQPLLARLRLDETCTASKLTPKEWLMKADKSLRIVVGKEALQWKKNIGTAGNSYTATLLDNGGGSGGICAGTSSVASSAAAGTTRERGKMHFALMMENTCNAVEKLHKLETLWPSLLLDVVRNTLLDYSQLEVYVRNLMNEIMK